MTGRNVAGTILVGMLLAFVMACRTARAPEPEPEQEQEQETVAEPEPGARLEAIRQELASVKAELNERGEYNCCIDPPCHWCALHEDGCDCFVNLEAGDEVCPGCGLGWHNGRGIVDGVDPDDVKWNITHEHPGGGEHAH